MNRVLAGALGAGLSLSLLAVPVPVLAQDAPITINANGDNSGAARGNMANNDGGDIVLGDISSLPPGTVIDVSNTPGPEQASGSGSETAAGSSGSASSGNGRTRDGATHSGDTSGDSAPQPAEGDLDGDNFPDALEADAGLDPENPDTDADGVADGDEANVFGTDPLVFDTDGDGYGDGEELFWTESDPLDPKNESGINKDRQAAGRDSQDELSSAQEIAPESSAPVAPPPARSEPSGIGGMISGPDDGTTAASGAATTYGDGDASAAPGDVTHASDAPAEPADTAAADAPATVSCDDFPSWYDAQTSYEAAGGVDADPALLDAIDRDHDGIACESLMETEG